MSNLQHHALFATFFLMEMGQAPAASCLFLMQTCQISAFLLDANACLPLHVRGILRGQVKLSMMTGGLSVTQLWHVPLPQKLQAAAPQQLTPRVHFIHNTLGNVNDSVVSVAHAMQVPSRRDPNAGVRQCAQPPGTEAGHRQRSWQYRRSGGASHPGVPVPPQFTAIHACPVAVVQVSASCIPASNCQVLSVESGLSRMLCSLCLCCRVASFTWSFTGWHPVNCRH